MRGETVDVADYAFETHICLIWGHNPNLCCHESKMQLQSSFDKSIVELFACKNCHDDLFLFESSAVIYQDFCLMIWIQNDRKTSSGLRVFYEEAKSPNAYLPWVYPVNLLSRRKNIMKTKNNKGHH